MNKQDFSQAFEPTDSLEIPSDPVNPVPAPGEPDPYPVTDPIPQPPEPVPGPNPDPVPGPPEPIPEFPPNIVFSY
jgi:hypothetical protein